MPLLPPVISPTWPVRSKIVMDEDRRWPPAQRTVSDPPRAVGCPDVILDGIREPEDLRELSYQDLTELSGEIRDFIVAAVAETGGHLGSNPRPPAVPPPPP